MRVPGVKLSMRTGAGSMPCCFHAAGTLTGGRDCTIHLLHGCHKISGYEELGKFEPWLFRIAMNRLRDEMRRRGATRCLSHLRPLAESLRARHPVRSVPRAGTAVRPSGGQLELYQRLISRYCIFGMSSEMSFKQIADVLEQPMGTVLARTFQGFETVA